MRNYIDGLLFGQNQFFVIFFVKFGTQYHLHSFFKLYGEVKSKGATVAGYLHGTSGTGGGQISYWVVG